MEGGEDKMKSFRFKESNLIRNIVWYCPIH